MTPARLYEEGAKDIGHGRQESQVVLKSRPQGLVVDVVTGLENAPDALRRLFTGENLGKQLVKIADPSL